MKDFLLFVKWQYAKLEFWQKVFIVSSFVMGFTAFRTDELSRVLFWTSLMIPVVYMFKWFVIDSMIENWKRFKKEKANLFNTIKEGK